MNRTKPSWLTTAIMVPVACMVGLPFYYILVNTFKTQQQASAAPLALPSPWYFGNWEKALANTQLPHAALNSAIVMIVSVSLMLVIGSMAAFGILTNRSWLSTLFGGLLIVAFVIPAQVTLIPLYQLMVGAHLVDNIGGLVVLYCGGSIFCYLLTIGYMRSVPIEIFEAARIDGASLWRIYWQIILPLIRPILVTVGVFQAMWVWNDFLYPNVFISSSENRTLVLEVYTAVSQFTVDWPAFMTTTVIVLIPMVIFFVFMQRHIIAGLLSGSLKG